jgi:hypothetical protein
MCNDMYLLFNCKAFVNRGYQAKNIQHIVFIFDGLSLLNGLDCKVFCY